VVTQIEDIRTQRPRHLRREAMQAHPYYQYLTWHCQRRHAEWRWKQRASTQDQTRDLPPIPKGLDASRPPDLGPYSHQLYSARRPPWPGPFDPTTTHPRSGSTRPPQRTDAKYTGEAEYQTHPTAASSSAATRPPPLKRQHDAYQQEEPWQATPYSESWRSRPSREDQWKGWQWREPHENPTRSTTEHDARDPDTGPCGDHANVQTQAFRPPQKRPTRTEWATARPRSKSRPIGAPPPQPSPRTCAISPAELHSKKGRQRAH